MPRGIEFGVGEGTMLFLPFGHGAKPISNDERSSGCPRHPGRDTDPLFRRGRENPFVDVWIDGDS